MRTTTEKTQENGPPQGSLFSRTKKADIQELFEEFHRNNPKIYELLRDYAFQAKARGFRRYSIKAIWERLRWDRPLSTSGDEEFKLNDHYYSRYARLLMEQEPDLKGFFETRELRR